MPDIQAHLADGTTLHFPDNTDPSVIQGVVKKQVSPSIPISGRIGFDASKAPTPVNQIPATPTQPVAPTADNSGFFGTVGKDVWNATAPLHQNPFSTPESTPGSGKFNGQPVTDPTNAASVSMLNRESAGQSPMRAIPEGIAESAFGGNMQGFDQAMKAGNYSQALGHAIVPVGQAALMGRGALEGSATEMPHSVPLGELQKGVADASYTRGLGVAETLRQASQNIHDAVGEKAQSFISKVDQKFPEGAIDPQPIMDAVNRVKAEVVKTPERFPSSLSQMLEPPPSELEQASVFRGAGISGRAKLPPSAAESFNTMSPSIRAQYLESLNPAERAAVEAGGSQAPTGNWSAETAKQWRSKIGAAMSNTSGPMKTVLREGYDNLTQQMRKAADASGALSDFTDYNNLHTKHMRFLDDPVVKKIMNGTTDKQTLGPLSDSSDMAHVRNLLSDWDKYGIKTEDLEKEGEDYGKAQSIMEKKNFRWFPGGTLGGAVGRMSGIGYMPGAVGGILADRLTGPAGKAASFIESSRVSPFYQAGAEKAAAISRGWDEGLPKISPSKIALKSKGKP